jgi:hypothetical protein
VHDPVLLLPYLDIYIFFIIFQLYIGTNSLEKNDCPTVKDKKPDGQKKHNKYKIFNIFPVHVKDATSPGQNVFCGSLDKFAGNCMDSAMLPP